MKTFKNFVAGKWVDAASSASFENRNPADWNDVIGSFPRSGAEDVERAVASAKRGFALWSRPPAPLRGDILRRIGDLMTKRKEEIADLMTREMGKPLDETRGDVAGIEHRVAATEGRRLFGHTVPSELKNKWAMSFRRPFASPESSRRSTYEMAIPTWKMYPRCCAEMRASSSPPKTFLTPAMCSSRSWSTAVPTK